MQSRQISQTLQYKIQESLQKCLRNKKAKTCGVSEHAANKAEPCVVEEHVGTNMIGGDKLSLDTDGATSSQSYANTNEQESNILAAPIALRDSGGGASENTAVVAVDRISLDAAIGKLSKHGEADELGVEILAAAIALRDSSGRDRL